MSEYQKDLNRFYHREYFDEKNPFFHVYNKEFDKINYFQDNWKEQYYNYYFNSNTDETKENICLRNETNMFCIAVQRDTDFDDLSREVAAHELAHGQGRNKASCNTTS